MIAAMVKTAVDTVRKAARRSSSKSGGGGNSVSFDPNLDYAEAIANTTDPQERERLLAARQAKIDALGLEGKVGSNDAVSVWNKSYRPYWVSSGQESRIDVTGLYDAAAKARLQAFETARNRIRQQLDADYRDIEASYRAGMTQTEVNARRSALGNEEKLAALGLSTGGAYAAPSSGYTETSRVAADNAYRSDLNALAAARLAARSAAARTASEQESGLLREYYTGEASAALQQAQSRLSQQNADRNYTISLAGLTGYINGFPTLAYQKAENEKAQMQETKERNAYEQAMARWKTYGYVLPADAALLGVAAGTPTSDQSYRSAQLRLSQLRTNYQVSR